MLLNLLTKYFDRLYSFLWVSTISTCCFRVGNNFSFFRWEYIFKWTSVEAASVPKVESSDSKEHSSVDLEESKEGESEEEDEDKDKKRKKKRVGFRDRKVSNTGCYDF